MINTDINEVLINKILKSVFKFIFDKNENIINII
jgi:hypothetical protein